MRCGMEVERTSTLTEAIRRIRRKRKPQPNLNTENDTPEVVDVASQALQLKKYIILSVRLFLIGSRIKNHTWTIIY